MSENAAVALDIKRPANHVATLFSTARGPHANSWPVSKNRKNRPRTVSGVRGVTATESQNAEVRRGLSLIFAVSCSLESYSFSLMLGEIAVCRESPQFVGRVSSLAGESAVRSLSGESEVCREIPKFVGRVRSSQFVGRVRSLSGEFAVCRVCHGNHNHLLEGHVIGWAAGSTRGRSFTTRTKR